MFELFEELFNHVIEIYDYYILNTKFIEENIELIERSIDRADIIYEFHKMDGFIELEELLEFNNWCNFQEHHASEKDLTFDDYIKFNEIRESNLDAYINDLPSKLEKEGRDLGFL